MTTSCMSVDEPGLAEDAASGVATRCTHKSSAGVGARSTHPQVPDRRGVLRPAGCRTQEEQLLEREFALKDIALAQAEFTFEIERREHLTIPNDTSDIRGVLRQRVDDGVPERLALLVPGAASQPVRSVLHEAGQDVFAGRRERRIG